jgi:tetratricopeptide (TPR) repeat protein
LDDLLARAQKLLASTEHGDSRLAADIAAALVERPQSAGLHNALGLVLTRSAQMAQGGGRLTSAQNRTAAGYFRRAFAADPRHVLAGLNLAESLIGAGDLAQAGEQARRTLAMLERDPDDLTEATPRPGWLDEGHFPPFRDLFCIEWERAARQDAGEPDQEIQAKRVLIRWRLHALLAEATGDLSHYYEAALARPDLPVTQAALGCALARARRFPEASVHLRRAVAGNPFDLPAARALFGVLGEIGDEHGRLALASDRLRLHNEAPTEVPGESWFTEAAAAEPEGTGHGFRAPVGSGLSTTTAASTTQPRSDSILPAQSAGPRPRVSLCMIVKNEEANLSPCLESVTGLVDETIVADTGSTDRTRDIPARAGARVVDFPWVDSFAAARNESLQHATGDWIFWLDADDRLDEENQGRLRTLFAGLRDENAAYAMKCVCLPDQSSQAATVVDHIRLFRNHPQARWKYRVHEQILPAVRRLGGNASWSVTFACWAWRMRSTRATRSRYSTSARSFTSCVSLPRRCRCCAAAWNCRPRAIRSSASFTRW